MNWIALIKAVAFMVGVFVVASVLIFITTISAVTGSSILGAFVVFFLVMALYQEFS